MKKVYKSVLDHPNKKYTMKVFGKDPETLDEVFDSVIAIVNDQCRLNNEPDVEVVGLEIALTYTPEVSNTHECPLLGTTNWGGNDKTAPRNYPGFQGFICIRYNKDNESFMDHYLGHTLTHTGSGGGGHTGPWGKIKTAYYDAPRHIQKTFERPEILRWDYKIFLDDFPELAGWVNKQMTSDMLVHGEINPITFNRTWHLKEQVQADKKFKAKFKKFKARRILNKAYAYE